MSDYGTNLRDDVLATWRDSSVATAAGIVAGTWASTAFPHVFWGSSGHHGQRNAGRMPMVQIAFDQGGSVFDGAMSDGGNLLMQCIALVEVIKLPDWDAAESLARSIALAGLGAMRATDALRIGNDVIEQAVESDFGLAIPVRFTVEQTYDTSDYTVA